MRPGLIQERGWCYGVEMEPLCGRFYRLPNGKRARFVWRVDGVYIFAGQDGTFYELDPPELLEIADVSGDMAEMNPDYN